LDRNGTDSRFVPAPPRAANAECWSPSWGDRRLIWRIRLRLQRSSISNGSGYPRGIRDLNPLVEIIIVSDIYDALLAPRPYRRVSFDNRTAIEEITAMAERHEIGWQVLKALVARNRSVPFGLDDIWVSGERRGHPPADNLYGETLDE